MQAFWETLDDHLHAGRTVVFALVVAHTRHSPGTTGARLLVAEGGTIEGTIGGGVMEYRLVERARTVLHDAAYTPEVIRLHHRERGEGEPSGLICAGEQAHILYRATPERDGEGVAVVVALRQEEAAAVVTIRREGLTVARVASPEGQPQVRFWEEDEAWRVEEQVLNLKRVAIMGGGHCGLALSRTMDHLGYDVQVFDTRPHLETFHRNTYARHLTLLADYREAGALIRHPKLTPVVVMTTDMVSDVRSLQGLLPYPFPFLGVMGSPAKIKRIRALLREGGATEAALSRLTAPVGLPIGSNTPEEIAVSVAAQLVKVRGGG